MEGESPRDIKVNKQRGRERKGRGRSKNVPEKEKEVPHTRR